MTDTTLSIIENEWPAIEQCILKYVEDWSICVQAGGHHGLYPKNLAKLFRGVYTFEADINNYSILRYNCTETNIVAHNKALSAYNHTVGIHRVNGGNSGQNMIVDGDDIQAITIDSLRLPSCGLIQLDIERHELFAIMGAIETIEKYKPVIILEGPETTNNTCNHILDQLGYRAVDRAGFDTVFKFVNAPKPFCEYVPL